MVNNLVLLLTEIWNMRLCITMCLSSHSVQMSNYLCTYFKMGDILQVVIDYSFYLYFIVIYKVVSALNISIVTCIFV